MEEMSKMYQELQIDHWLNGAWDKNAPKAKPVRLQVIDCEDDPDFLERMDEEDCMANFVKKEDDCL